MIRFLFLCTLFFLLYLGFMSISEFDSEVKFSIYNYQIETTAFFFGTAFLLTQLALVIVLKFIFLIFDIPTIIRKKWLKRKLKQINAKLLKALSELLMGNQNGALDIAKTILPEMEEENRDLTHLIKAAGEMSFDKKIYYLRTLVDKKHFSIYAAKSLAELFFLNSYYSEAEEYAVKAFNEDDTNTDIMIILIRIYAKLANWPRMVFIVSKLQRADSKLLEKNAHEIASYYYNAAKSVLELGEDLEAIKFLESSLELRPDYIEALNLFIELNINIQNTADILKILKAAFSVKPCFEIALLYIKCSKSSLSAVYGTLAKIASPNEHNALFLAIAAYLDLPDKIKEIKEPKGTL
jgi:uncharacterized membrane-anchored protein